MFSSYLNEFIYLFLYFFVHVFDTYYMPTCVKHVSDRDTGFGGKSAQVYYPRVVWLSKGKVKSCDWKMRGLWVIVEGIWQNFGGSSARKVSLEVVLRDLIGQWK